MIMSMQNKMYEDLIEVFKMYRGFSKVLLHELLTLSENSKSKRGHSCKLVNTGELATLPSISFQITLLKDGICWTRGRWMLVASMHLNLDQ